MFFLSVQLSYTLMAHTKVLSIVRCCCYLYRKVYIHFPNYNPIIVHSSRTIRKAIENSSLYTSNTNVQCLFFSHLRMDIAAREAHKKRGKLMISIIIIDLYCELRVKKFSGAFVVRFVDVCTTIKMGIVISETYERAIGRVDEQEESTLSTKTFP